MQSRTSRAARSGVFPAAGHARDDTGGRAPAIRRMAVGGSRLRRRLVSGRFHGQRHSALHPKPNVSGQARQMPKAPLQTTRQVGRRRVGAASPDARRFSCQTCHSRQPDLFRLKLQESGACISDRTRHSDFVTQPAFQVKEKSTACLGANFDPMIYEDVLTCASRRQAQAPAGLFRRRDPSVPLHPDLVQATLARPLTCCLGCQASAWRLDPVEEDGDAGPMPPNLW